MPASSPATFTVDGFAPSEAVTFAIPAGTYTSAQWDYTGSSVGAADPYGCLAYTGGGANTALFPTHPVSGTVTDSFAASASQLADINAAAGGSLSAGFSLDGALIGTEQLDVSAFTLTLTGAPVPPPMPSLDGGGGEAPAPILILEPVFTAEIGAPAVTIISPARVLTPISSGTGTLYAAYCRDLQGIVWSPSAEASVDTGVDLLSAGVCFAGGRWIALYTKGNVLKSRTATDPETWTAGVTTVSAAGLPGSTRVWGFCVNAQGVLCGLLTTGVVISRDYGVTWEFVSCAWLSGGVRTVCAEDSAFVVVMVDGSTVSHRVSLDGGATWV